MQNKNLYETDKVPSIGIWEVLKSNRFLSKFANLIDPPDPVFITNKSRSRIPKLLGTLDPVEKSLNVGSGTTRYSEGIINVDLFPMVNVDVLGNAAFLPFKDDSFNLVICQAVLEHVEEPNQTIKEIHRVLKEPCT